MLAGYLCLFLLGLIVLVARMCRTTDLSQGASENAAHAAALLKRIQSEREAQPKPHRERRYKTTLTATAKIMGVEESEGPCRIVNISSSGMRIKWSATVPAVSQVEVHWGDHFFIGSIRHQSVQAGCSMIGLQLNFCNYIRIPWQWRIPYFGALPVTAEPAQRYALPEPISDCEQFLLELLAARRLDQGRPPANT